MRFQLLAEGGEKKNKEKSSKANEFKKSNCIFIATTT
jgi:hypothetical protein